MVDLDRLRIADEPPGSRRPRWPVAVLVLAAFAAGGSAVHWGPRLFAPAPIPVTTATVQSGGGATAGLVAGGWVEVAKPGWPLVVPCRLSERIESITVKEGDSIQPGQVLATMYDRDQKQLLAATEARRSVAERELALLKAGYRHEDIQASEARVAQAEATLAYARSRAARHRSAETAMAIDALDRSAAEERAAIAGLDAARAELARLKAGYRSDEVLAAEARVSEAQASVALAQLQLSYCTITAPPSARPLRVLRVLHQVGSWIDRESNHDLLELYDPAALQVRVDVPQRSLRQVAVGAAVEIRTDAHPDQRWSGTVVRIEPLAEVAKNTITVRAVITAPDDRLHPEMTCQVMFQGATGGDGDRSLRIPADALRTDAAGTHVLVADGGRARRVAVDATPSGPWATVRSGLRSGQRVITGAAAGLGDGTPITDAP